MDVFFLQKMFENVIRMNADLGGPFRDEASLQDRCLQMILKQQFWIVTENAEAVDDRLIYFEKGKEYLKQNEWDLALVKFIFESEFSSVNESDCRTISLALRS